MEVGGSQNEDTALPASLSENLQAQERLQNPIKDSGGKTEQEHSWVPAGSLKSKSTNPVTVKEALVPGPSIGEILKSDLKNPGY